MAASFSKLAGAIWTGTCPDLAIAAALSRRSGMIGARARRCRRTFFKLARLLPRESLSPNSAKMMGRVSYTFLYSGAKERGSLSAESNFRRRDDRLDGSKCRRERERQ